MIFDIKDFYSSINKKLLDNSINFVRTNKKKRILALSNKQGNPFSATRKLCGKRKTHTLLL